MIIANGYITPIEKQGGGINSVTRQPVAPQLLYGSPVECQIIRTRDLRATDSAGNPVTSKSFEVYVEGEYKGAENVRLSDMNGSILVDKAALRSSEFLSAVNQTRLTL